MVQSRRRLTRRSAGIGTRSWRCRYRMPDERWRIPQLLYCPHAVRIFIKYEKLFARHHVVEICVCFCSRHSRLWCAFHGMLTPHPVTDANSSSSDVERAAGRARSNGLMKIYNSPNNRLKMLYEILYAGRFRVVELLSAQCSFRGVRNSHCKRYEIYAERPSGRAAEPCLGMCTIVLQTAVLKMADEFIQKLRQLTNLD